MIFLYIFFLLLSIIVFLLTKKLTLASRIVLALCIFIILTVGATLLILKIGDKAPPDAITVYPKKAN